MTGKAKKLGVLTDDDLTQINRRRDQLVGKLRERCGHGKNQVQKDFDEVVSGM